MKCNKIILVRRAIMQAAHTREFAAKRRILTDNDESIDTRDANCDTRVEARSSFSRVSAKSRHHRARCEKNPTMSVVAVALS